MARFSRLEVLNTIMDTGLVPIFYNPDLEAAINVVNACAAGGSRVAEFTNRGDFAPEVFKELSRHVARELPDIILGVGSVIDEPTAAMYVAYGANFVVGPSLNETVARFCNRRKVPYVPGCGSATEISLAEELGVEIVKIFPGCAVGGPEFVKSVLGPCPWTRMMPTAGVDATQESIEAWFGAGVCVVGIGSNLIRQDLVAAGDWEEISNKVRQVLGWIKEARGEPVFLGVEHVGIYATEEASAEAIGQWYAARFGFELKEAGAAFFASGAGNGRLEIMKEAITDRCHVAVQVSSFDRAVAALEAQGVEIEEPIVGPGFRVAYLKERDPAGNLVHVLVAG